jgi:hypothetical protein
MADKSLIAPDDFRQIYDLFQASISRFDCGQKCAPLNGGEPVCCSTQHAVPVVQKVEWELLKSRTDMWTRFKPYDRATRQIVKEIGSSCAAVECRGARFCERDNRSLACRAFPFFPYIDRAGKFIGLAYYWDFEDRCWVISNMQIVEAEFLKDFVKAFELLFERDPEEYDNFKSHSASMRRVFSRRRKPIVFIGLEGGFFEERAYGKGIRPIEAAKLPKFGPYKSDRAYARALKEAQAEAAACELHPDAHPVGDPARTGA